MRLRQPKRRLKPNYAELYQQIITFHCDDSASESDTKRKQVEDTHQAFIKKYADLEIDEAVERFATNENNKPIELRPWLREVLKLKAATSIRTIINSGSQQTSKTTSDMLTFCYWFLVKGYPLVYSWERGYKRTNQVKGQLYKILDNWADNMGLNVADFAKKNTEVCCIGNVESRFIFANNSNDDETAVNSQVSSYMVYGGMLDEFSQYPATFLPLVRKRLTSDQNPLKAEPLRLNGTCGRGRGTGFLVKQAKYWFYPHYTCDNCKQTLPLNHYGCLLLPEEYTLSNGQKRNRYLSATGRPINWHHTKGDTFENKLKTAYWGCSSCGHPIRDEQRSTAWMQDRKHDGLTLLAFLADIEDIDMFMDEVGVTMPPALRVKTSKDAYLLIKEGLETENVRDFLEQSLGEESSVISNGINRETLELAIGAPVPDKEPDFVTVGIDLGTTYHYLARCEWYMPDGWEQLITPFRRIPKSMTWEEVFVEKKPAPPRYYDPPPDNPELHLTMLLESAICRVTFLDRVSGVDIAEHYEGLSFGLVDGRFGRRESFLLSKASGIIDYEYGLKGAVSRYKLQLASQRPFQANEFAVGKVEIGGEQLSCWNLDNDLFMTGPTTLFATTLADGYPAARLPVEFEKQLNAKDDDMPLSHLQSVWFDENAGRWERPKSKKDDFYMALGFSRAAFAILIGHIFKNRAVTNNAPRSKAYY